MQCLKHVTKLLGLTAEYILGDSYAILLTAITRRHVGGIL